jgi:hypothetical protein
MGSLNPFKKPKVTKPKPVNTQALAQKTGAPSKQPTASDADVQKAAQDELEMLRKQRGRASTILTSGQGIMGDDSSSGLATRRLMGG